MNKIIKATEVNKIIESVELVRGRSEKLPDIPSYIDKLKLKLDSVISYSTTLSKLLDNVKRSIGMKTGEEKAVEKAMDFLRDIEANTKGPSKTMTFHMDTDIVTALAELQAYQRELRDEQKSKLKVVPKQIT